MTLPRATGQYIVWGVGGFGGLEPADLSEDRAVMIATTSHPTNGRSE
jgi:hypothetical protein